MKTIVCDRFETMALAKLIGARFSGGHMVGNRVELEFEADSDHERAIADFEAGVGPEGNLPQYFDSLVWAKNQTFAIRRRLGADR